ncbi:MAG TPA: hypothetical protein GYA10_01030, partial [Alphaproteobacteria bacterium]|nr:hypothetical protein [Alphaproteobacteria bacterium]
MTLALEMFAVAPASGKANLSALQQSLLSGKARWLHAAAEAGLPTVPTIAITRAAWEGLQQERKRGEDRLRTHWVATLFRLVGRDGHPPHLVVRTSAEQHKQGLMSARVGLPPPASEAEAVDPRRPLARAIEDAFASYGDDTSLWTGPEKSTTREGQIVIVQAVAPGRLVEFLTRDPATGALGPVVANGAALPEGAAHLARALDAVAGQALNCLVAIEGQTVRLVS